MNIVLITNIPAPYRIPVYNVLVDKIEEFTVLFLGENEKNRKWSIIGNNIKFKFKVLRGWHLFFQNRDWGLHINYDLLLKLARAKANVFVVTGYESPSYWLAILYAKLFRKKIVFWNGSTLLSSRSKNIIVNFLRKVFIRSVDAYLTYGLLAKEFLINYGAKPDKIVVGCNAVDIKKFRHESQLLYSQKEIIKRNKILPKFNILFSGQLIERKGLLMLLEAFNKIGRNDVGLIVIGDGPEKEKYQNYCQDNKIKNIFFMGHQPENKLAEYYTITDVLVVPSLIEVWGLVVNEAMACGLPVICSDRVGASRDLIKNGVNGFIYEAENVNSLADCLRKLLANEQLRIEMGRKSLELISECTPENYAKNLIKAVNLAL